MALPETLLAQANRFLDAAARCPTPKSAEILRGAALALLAFAHREAAVCSHTTRTSSGDNNVVELGTTRRQRSRSP